MSVTIGTTYGGIGNGLPFDLTGVVDYEQIYSAAAFSGPISFNTITFFDTQIPGSSITDANYDITFSYTSSPLNSNYPISGTGTQTFFDGILGGPIVGTSFSITGSTFNYDPALGNLLIDVQVTNQQMAGHGGLDRDAFTGVVSRAFDQNGIPITSDNIGLVTQFSTTVLLTAAPDRAHVQEGHSVTADAAHGVLANDSDPIPNDALTVSEVDGQASNVGMAVAGAYGKLTLNANGSYTYVATAHDKALPSDGVGLDTFTYIAKDGAGGTADTTLTVVVTAPGITYLGGTADATIHGGNGHQVLDGGAGNDVVIAGTGTQVLIGGPGDTLTGGQGADTFVFPPNFGDETITDFDAHHDAIQLPHSEFANVATVLADIHQAGANVEIAPDAHDVITLNNVTAHQLHASNFHLV